MKLLFLESLLLFFLFILIVFLYVYKDRKGGLHWYPNNIQEIAIKRGIISKNEIDKNNKQSKSVMIIVVLIFILISVFVVNKTDQWFNASLQIYILLFILNIFDAIIIDWFWVSKTTFWIIPELSDLTITKSYRYLIKERLIMSVIYIPFSCLLGCISFIL